jgi:hypothetical protein
MVLPHFGVLRLFMYDIKGSRSANISNNGFRIELSEIYAIKGGQKYLI